MAFFRKSNPPSNRPANGHEIRHRDVCRKMGLDHGWVYRNDEEGYVVEANIPSGPGGTLAAAIFHLTGADAGGVDAANDRRKAERDMRELGISESEVRRYMRMSQGDLRRSIDNYRRPSRQRSARQPAQQSAKPESIWTKKWW
jgi:hypothetical protein